MLAACSQRRCSALQWNPDIATQLIVASDDDRSPTLQMWDLRNSVSPLKEFVAHTKVSRTSRSSMLDTVNKTCTDVADTAGSVSFSWILF
jgi:hypothetical protein